MTAYPPRPWVKEIRTMIEIRLAYADLTRRRAAREDGLFLGLTTATPSSIKTIMNRKKLS